MKTLKTLCALALVLAPIGLEAQPAPQEEGGVRWLCGGVAQAEQQAMRAAAGSYDLMLTFANSAGQYLADVEVEIAGPRGAPLLATRCDGPMMLVDLPAAGRWQVSARASGQELRRTVTTRNGGKPARAVFTWKAASVGQ